MDSTLLFWDHVDHFYIIWLSFLCCWISWHICIEHSLLGISDLSIINVTKRIRNNMCHFQINVELNYRSTCWLIIVYNVINTANGYERGTFLCAKLNELLCIFLWQPACTVNCLWCFRLKYCNKWKTMTKIMLWFCHDYNRRVYWKHVLLSLCIF